MKLFKISLGLLSICFISMSYAWQLKVYSMNDQPLTTFNVEDNTTVLEVRTMLKKL
jgi:hypothetical protein